MTLLRTSLLVLLFGCSGQKATTEPATEPAAAPAQQPSSAQTSPQPGQPGQPGQPEGQPPPGAEGSPPAGHALGQTTGFKPPPLEPLNEMPTLEDPPGSPCLPGMAPVTDKAGKVQYCIDRYEARAYGGDPGNLDQGKSFPDGTTTAKSLSAAGIKPTVFVSWYQSYAICKNSGKHLCTTQEWIDACDGTVGEGGTMFPWGEAPTSQDVCATTKQAPGEVADAGMHGAYLNGEYPNCKTPTGVFDLTGNVWEWVDGNEKNAEGVVVPHKVGGAFYAGPENAKCTARPDKSHTPEFNGVIGFRCCAPPK